MPFRDIISHLLFSDRKPVKNMTITYRNVTNTRCFIGRKSIYPFITSQVSEFKFFGSLAILQTHTHVCVCKYMCVCVCVYVIMYMRLRVAVCLCEACIIMYETKVMKTSQNRKFINDAFSQSVCSLSLPSVRIKERQNSR